MNKTERPFTDSNLLRAFVEIAECKNLTLAASRLNRSQSAISVQIRKLETVLDASLFIREGKGMSLSASGEKLLPAARFALAELSKIPALFEKPLKGKIKVGIPDDFDEGTLERTLADFARTNPNVEVLASSGCTADFPEALKRGELDIAVMCEIDRVTGEPLIERDLVWAANENMVLLPSEPIPLAVINHECWMGKLPKTTLQKSGRNYNIAFECSGIAYIGAAISAGLAVGIIFKSSIEPGMKLLSVKDGFPKLPTVKRSVIVSPEAPKDITQAMAQAIKNAV